MQSHGLETPIWAFSREGYETIIVNNNPETVSTDFDIADKLYFEPLTPEDMEAIVELERPDGAVVQFGGQISNSSVRGSFFRASSISTKTASLSINHLSIIVFS